MEQKELREKARELYLMLLISAPQYPLQIYRDALGVLGAVIRDEKEPAEIPYPLFCPIDEDKSGLEYAVAWMQQAIFENMILRCFPKDIIAMLPPINGDAPVNLCEAVLINAAGRILLKKDPFSIFLTEAEAKTIVTRFKELGEEKSMAHLALAANNLCFALKLDQTEGKEKIRALISTIYHRSKAENSPFPFHFILH